MKIAEAVCALARGDTTSQRLLEDCIENIEQDGSQASTVFTKRYDTKSLIAQAKSIDKCRDRGDSLPPCAGIPISIKDLFDVKGDVTTAGSRILSNDPAASRDALVVRRVRRAGFLLVGRTNMTEFAYSGLGINPHYGTPLNPFDRQSGRIPGGSSSGAAISITDGMAFGALGTDTGGSCRIPSALCGIVGLKPTAKRVPQDGVFPLSPSLDSVGILAGSVSCCSILDSVVSGNDDISEIEAYPLRGLRLAVPTSFVLDDLDEIVAKYFDRAVKRLGRAGAVIVEERFAELLEIRDINANGGFAAAEAYALHRERIAQHYDEYDPRVACRILRGRDQTAADYLELMTGREAMKKKIGKTSTKYDAIILPTTPRIAPLIADLADDEYYHDQNLLMLRNPSVANLLDRCAISIPCHDPDTAPVGLMLIGEHGDDGRLQSIAHSVETIMTLVEQRQVQIP